MQNCTSGLESTRRRTCIQ